MDYNNIGLIAQITIDRSWFENKFYRIWKYEFSGSRAAVIADLSVQPNAFISNWLRLRIKVRYIINPVRANSGVRPVDCTYCFRCSVNMSEYRRERNESPYRRRRTPSNEWRSSPGPTHTAVRWCCAPSKCECRPSARSGSTGPAPKIQASSNFLHYFFLTLSKHTGPRGLSTKYADFRTPPPPSNF